MRIFHDLLMLHGHISDPRLARELAGVPDPADAVEARPEPASCRDAKPAGARFGRGVTTLCATALSLFR